MSVHTTTIYLLSDPSTGRVRYVGKTLQELRVRYAGHLSTAKLRRRGTHKENWVRSVGGKPTLTTVEVVTGSIEEGAEVERRWIARLKADGCDLTNLTDGGEGIVGYRFSEAARAKLSAIRRGVKKGPLTPEHRAKIGAANRGRKHSPDAIAKMSARRRERPPASEETRAKIGAAQIGRKHTDEAKAKIGRAHKGRTFSPETIAKMRLAARLRWVNRRTAA